MKRAFVFKDEKSNKFWWIENEGVEFVANWGKSGTDGRYEIKDYIPPYSKPCESITHHP